MVWELSFIMFLIFYFIRLFCLHDSAYKVWQTYLGFASVLFFWVFLLFFLILSFYILIVGNWESYFFFNLFFMRLSWPHDLNALFLCLTQVTFRFVFFLLLFCISTMSCLRSELCSFFSFDKRSFCGNHGHFFIFNSIHLVSLLFLSYN